MGEAKKRGTFEERKAQAIARRGKATDITNLVTPSDSTQKQVTVPARRRRTPLAASMGLVAALAAGLGVRK